MQNGFEDALKNLKTVVNVNQKVTLDIMTEAAEYFAEQLRNEFTRSKINKKHAADAIEVIVSKDVVQVVFGDDGWYWYLDEHGHKKRNGRGRVRGNQVVRKTMEKESKKLEQMILNKLK
ncbi:MAG: hypothetical protein ACOYEB_00610 [Enterococcus lemanii]|jgi:hypothetical protein